MTLLIPVLEQVLNLIREHYHDETQMQKQEADG